MADPSPISILHVDDDPDVAETTASSLERAGEEVRVETAPSVEAGLERLEDGRFDCVVSDHDVPGTDGIGFLDAVRERYPELPFVLFTGAGSEAVASEAISAGVTDYVQKQAGDDQYALLLNRIRTAVEASRDRGTAAETEQWARTMLEYSSDLLFVMDASGTLSYVSPSVRRVLGYDPDALVGESAVEFVHPDDAERASETLLGTRGEPDAERTVEFRVVDAAGEVRWLSARGRNLLDDPVVDGILVDAREVTETHLQNRAFESFVDVVTGESRSLDERIREILGIGVRFLGLDIGIVSRIEPPDYHVEHVVTPDGSIEPGDTFDFTDTYCSLVYESDGPVAFRSPADGGVEEHPCYRKMGLRAYLGEPLVVDGSRYGTLNFSSHSSREEPFTDGERAFIRAVSEWIGTEMSRRRSRERIESQREALEQFVSFASHDLRNPLSVAQGQLVLARKQSESDHLERAARAIDRSQQLIDDLLAVAREGHVVTATTGTDLDELARECWTTVETGEATLTPETGLVVEASAGRLQQLLENLFRNAVEHAGPQVSVTVGALDDGAGFFVADDGPGIPEDEREDVFEMGYSASPDGTGVGLRIVQQVAAAHGWEVDLGESAAGGARFEFRNVTPVE
jgi:PAS domain S-box-containing protein